MSSRSSQYVEVQLEIGHKATPKTKQGPDGHTHDWTVFVRGPENSNIQHFVEKVVFHLHDSFPKPKRVVKEPPYQVSESGYASFELPVEVYFKNKEEPKKICFDYDLYLRLDDAVSHSRREKLTFQNPSNDFKKKLLKAGGVTNESNASSAVKSGVVSDEKQVTPQPASGNTAKPYKPNPSVSESKKSKTSGVIPSKDKSLNNSQNISSVSSNQTVVSEKHPIPSSNNKQFTDLFGTPIQARPSSDSKNKESLTKSKFTAIASKGVKNDSKSLHKNSTKKSFSSPSHKTNDIKSSKDTKESKDSKMGTKTKESTKGKREDDSTKNKSKTKTQSQQQSQQSPKIYDIDKKPDFKSTKKRRNSTSSTSSSLTASSFSGSTESKLHKEEPPKSGSLKEKDNKKESKKQKISSKDMNTASGVKKQSSTSTKISFSDNNSSTTIEIKSVKKEKTWDNEVKKSRSKEFKSSEFKAAKDKDKDKTNPNSSNTTLGTNKTKSKTDANPLKSGKVESNKNLKASKEKHSSRPRKRSTSLSSESHLTPALSSPSNSGPNFSTALDVESHESLSPLSSDNASISFTQFKPNRNNRELNNESNNRFISDDSDSDVSEDLVEKNRTSKKKDFESNNKKKTQFPNSQINKRKRDLSKDSHKKLDQSKSEIALTPGPDLNDSLLSNDLIEMQKKISESTNSDLLQTIVDIIEESGIFALTKTSFDFDLMKLDDKTIKKLKTFLK